MPEEIKTPIVNLPANWRQIAKNVAGERRSVSVSEKETEATLLWLRKSRATYAQVSRPGKIGDAVIIDFETKSEGRFVDDGKAHNHRLVLGEGGYFPGFQEAILGLKANEAKDFSINVPANYWQHDLAGKKLDFHVTMQSVQERILPEANDEFAKSVSRFQNMADLRKSITEGLRQEKEEKERQRFRLLILEQISSQTKFELAPQAVESEIDVMVAELKASVGAMGLDWQNYLKQIKETERGLADKLRGEAEKRLRYALVLRQIAEEERIEPSPEEIKEEANKFLQRFSSAKETEQSIDMISLFAYSKNVLRNEKVFQLLEN